MKNTLGDLNLHLFAQLERLSDEDVKGEELIEEIRRAKAITTVAKEIISNGELVLKAKELETQYSFDGKKIIPNMLEG